MPKQGQLKGTPSRRAEFIEYLRGLGPGEEHIYWPWSDRRDNYARVYIEGRKVNAHRWVYEQINGPLPARDGPGAKGDDLVLHTCDVRFCLRPSHLYLGDAQQNLDDARQRGRLPAHRRRNKLSVDDVRLIRHLVPQGTRMAALARVFGVSPGYISDIVNGRARPND